MDARVVMDGGVLLREMAVMVTGELKEPRSRRQNDPAIPVAMGFWD